jgi:carboxypeptidase Taq
VDSARAYQELLARFREIALLSSCATLLAWDEETYMPPGGVEHRARQLALLAGLRHQRLSDPSLGDLIEAAAGPHVPEARRLHHRYSRVPRKLVEEIAEVTTIAQHAWATARAAATVDDLLPWLEKILALKTQEANAIGFADGGEAYDVALDEFEPGANTREIGSLLENLASDLRPLFDRIMGSPHVMPKEILRAAYPIASQRAFALEAAAAIGFDFTRGRLDTSAHPFSASVGPGDCRLTTRFLPGDFSEGFFCTLHEAGHGLYDQGVGEEEWSAPGGDNPSLGLHESQARLWENFVGRTHGFWRCFFPRAQAAFAPMLDGVSLDAFHAAVNHVEPSCLRVRADMVTYDLHILVRFELERALFRGELAVAELEGAWNERMRRHLGLTVKKPAEGMLQDGHWAAGMFGYFPTYTIGNLIGAQLYRAAERDLGELEPAFARGEFAPLLEWLRTHVHRVGPVTAAEVVVHATGSPPSHRHLVENLTARLTPIYEL